MLSDERGAWSHKRLIGFLCAIILCASLIITSIAPKEYQPPATLVDAVLTLACVCVAGTTLDKFSYKEKPNQDA